MAMSSPSPWSLEEEKKEEKEEEEQKDVEIQNLRLEVQKLQKDIHLVESSDSSLLDELFIHREKIEQLQSHGEMTAEALAREKNMTSYYLRARD